MTWADFFISLASYTGVFVLGLSMRRER